MTVAAFVFGVFAGLAIALFAMVVAGHLRARSHQNRARAAIERAYKSGMIVGWQAIDQLRANGFSGALATHIVTIWELEQPTGNFSRRGESAPPPEMPTLQI